MGCARCQWGTARLRSARTPPAPNKAAPARAIVSRGTSIGVPKGFTGADCTFVARRPVHEAQGGRMEALMQDYPLALPHIFYRAERMFPGREIVTATATGKERTTYGRWAERTRRLGGALDQLDISADGRVATFGWNTARHLELYFAAPCSGRVLHTLNIRLFADQLTYIVNHAEDEVIFVDRSLIELLWPLVGEFKSVRHYVVMDDGKGTIPDDPRIVDYEELIGDADPVEFRVGDENQAAAMCYTSGTTGNPKGVVYSHRSMFLHSMSVCTGNGLGMNHTDKVLPVVPMFHANAWGLPYAAVMAGASLVMPDRFMQAEPLVKLIELERPTVSGAVPTIWNEVLRHAVSQGSDLRSLRLVPCG